MNVLAESKGERWSLYQADCVELARDLPANSVDLIVTSPPYSNTYMYSDSERDMGNCASDAEFYERYEFLVREMLRILRPGRVACIECKDLVDYAGTSGKAGLRDFPGEIVRIHKRVGFSWHSRVTIWRSPVTEMQKTKAHGLLYKQLRTDSTFSRMGMPVYVLMFRKWAMTEDEQRFVDPVSHTSTEFPLDRWQSWASPVWMDVDFTDVLNVFTAREDKDEKHLAPMPLPIIERCVGLYSNPGDCVFDPFSGVGSTGYQALKMGRRFLGSELKSSYFAQARRYLHEAETVKQATLFDDAACGGG